MLRLITPIMDRRVASYSWSSTRAKILWQIILYVSTSWQRTVAGTLFWHGLSADLQMELACSCWSGPECPHQTGHQSGLAYLRKAEKGPPRLQREDTSILRRAAKPDSPWFHPEMTVNQCRSDLPACQIKREGKDSLVDCASTAESQDISWRVVQHG